MRLVLLGPPGAGKGTQGQALAAAYGVPHVATGDILRDQITRGTEFGRKIQAVIAAGNFVTDEDILYWVNQRLAEADTQTGYILDGFPRDLHQAKTFTESLDAVIVLLISDEALIERLSGRLVCPTCGETYHRVHRPPLKPGICDSDGTPLVRRADDEPQAIRQRLKVYHELTEPLEAYYETRGLLAQVDACGDAEDVTIRITQALSVRTLEKVAI